MPSKILHFTPQTPTKQKRTLLFFLKKNRRRKLRDEFPGRREKKRGVPIEYHVPITTRSDGNTRLVQGWCPASLARRRLLSYSHTHLPLFPKKKRGSKSVSKFVTREKKLAKGGEVRPAFIGCPRGRTAETAVVLEEEHPSFTHRTTLKNLCPRENFLGHIGMAFGFP